MNSKHDTPSTRYPFYLWNNPTLCPSKRLAHDQGAGSTRLRLALRRRKKKKRKRQLQQGLKLFLLLYFVAPPRMTSFKRQIDNAKRHMMLGF
jgi:hypothetical protein